MKTSFLRFVFPLAALALVVPTGALAQKGKGDTGSTPSGPTLIPSGIVNTTYVIDKPGSYALAGNREMTDLTKPAIKIDAADVTLDLGGFRLSFAGDSTAGVGAIHVEAPENLVVRDGTIANGYYGIGTGAGKGVTFSRLRVYGGMYGLLSSASATVVEECQVFDTTYRGIAVWNNNSVVRNCQVDTTAGTGVQAINAQIIDSQIRGGVIGVELTANASLINSLVTGASAGGVLMTDSCVVRGSHIVDSTGTGIAITGTGNMVLDTVVASIKPSQSLHRGIATSSPFLLAGTRITNTGDAVVGTYVNGGGNSIW